MQQIGPGKSGVASGRQSGLARNAIETGKGRRVDGHLISASHHTGYPPVVDSFY